MKTIATFNALHLGDNLVHLHFMRALAKAYPEIAFTHGAPDQHLAQLAPLCWDLDNLTLTSIAATPPGAINAWRGADGWWYGQVDRHDFAAVHLKFFAMLATRMGLESPLKTPSDLLFDYDALRVKASPSEALAKDGPCYDFLVINSPPMSGQWSGFNLEAFDQLCTLLYQAGHRCITTHPSTAEDTPCTRARKLDVTGIGRLSQSVRCIIGCVTGPMWPTMSVFHDPKILRIHLLDTERVELCPNTIHANSLTLVPEILRERGLL